MRLPKLGTTASRDFFNTYTRINVFVNWIAWMTKRIDAMVDKFDEIYREYKDVFDDIGVEHEDHEERYSMADIFKENRNFLVEIILVRHVENYLNYLSSLLYEIFTQRTETLKSSDKIEISEVLEHRDIDDLVRNIAERKVDSLSYISFEKLCDYFQDHFGLELFPEKDIPFITESIEIRNISVHNRCIINRRFVSRTETDQSLIGTRRKISLDDIDTLMSKLSDSVIRLDRRARKKLGLKGIRFRVEPYK